MTSTSAASSVPLSRDEAGGLLGQTMGLVAFTAGFFALGAYLGRNTSGGWAIVFFIAAFAVMTSSGCARRRTSARRRSLPRRSSSTSSTCSSCSSRSSAETNSAAI
jgi:hypothetical protein